MSAPTPKIDTPLTEEYFKSAWKPGMLSRKEFCQKLERENAALRDAHVKALETARDVALRGAYVCSCSARRMGFENQARELGAAIEAARKQEGK